MPVQRTRDIHSRTLEVTTDAQEHQPPSFNIVSPTPRAFTFPATNHLSDSPYSSRSNSPMESDPYSIPFQQCTISTSSPSSSFTPPLASELSRTDSPMSPMEAIALQRRKSSCSSDNLDRRPKKGEEDYIKRPENAFILFRRKCCEERQAAQDEASATAKGPTKKQRQADLSKTISQQWKSLSNEERAKWEEMAKSKKAEHEKRYPHYVYRPQRAKDKDGKTKNNKKGKKGDYLYDESTSLSFVVPIPRAHHGRSNSAPSPPPYQSIQMPNVYHMPSSSPTSPSLLPMISRRSAYPGPAQDCLSSFDFLPPSQPYVPPSYVMSGQFEESLQSSEFLRSMFGTAPNHHQQDTVSPLQQISIPEHTDSMHHVSPSSSVGSSSGPSSPSSGPYTPTTMLSHNFAHLSPDASLEAQAQAEIDLQLEMQLQQEYVATNWETPAGTLWEPSFGDNDFDISAIAPVVPLDFPLTKYTESISIAPGVDYAHEYAHLVDGVHYHDESRSLGIIGFDEMMAGHGF